MKQHLSKKLILIAILFSFIHITNAQPYCGGNNAVGSCGQLNDPADCTNSYRAIWNGGNTQCEWNSSSNYCRATGGPCNPYNPLGKVSQSNGGEESFPSNGAEAPSQPKR
jgi:hypothetical protein